MAAPEGNKFWQIRSKHGREKLFKNAKRLKEAADEYFQWCIDNPIQMNEVLKSGDRAGEQVQVDKARPFTLHGLCIYLDCHTGYFKQFKARLREGMIKNPDGFEAVIQQIEETIYAQKFEGAAVGAFNANIISRDLGLMDQQNINHNIAKLPMPVIKVMGNAPPIASSEDEVDIPEGK